MPPVPVRLSVVALDLATAFTDAPVPPEWPPMLAQLDQGGVVVHGYRVVDSAEGRIVQLRFPPGPAREARLAIPGVTVVELVATLGGDTALEIAEPGPHTRYAEVRGLRVAVRFDPALLRPVDGAPRAELVWTGALRWHRDWRVELVGDPGLSMSPCEIAGSGIVIELAGLELDLSTDRSPSAILGLGLDAGFQGVYARGGSLQLLPQARFGGRAGIRVDVRDLAVGTGGVTGRVARYYPLERTAEGGLDPTNALIGGLFDDAWQLGIGTIEVGLRANAVDRFLVEGLVQVPLIDPFLDVRFGMDRSDTGYATTLHLGSPTSISIPVAGGQIVVGSFAFDGSFDGPDAIAVSGLVTDVEVDLAPVRVTAGRVSAVLERHRDGEELRVALRDVALGPLGTLDTAELVLTQTPTGRSIRFEASVAWDDLRGRLDLPPGVPEPAGGRASVDVGWADDGHVVVRVAAEIEDLSSLLSVVPTAYRPQIEAAALAVTIDYPDEAAFGAASASAPLTGSVAIAVTVRLPMLSALPGVLAVRAGDANGRVRAALSLTVGAGRPRVEFALSDPVALDLTLPGLQAGAPVVTLSLDSIGLTEGDGPGRSTFTLAGAASTPAMDDYLTDVAVGLGLPSTLGSLLRPLGAAVAGDGTVTLSVAFDGTTATPSVEIVSRPASPPTLALLEAIGAVADPGATPPSGATALPGLGVPADLFTVSPGELRLSAALTNPPSLRLSGSLEATVLGETFDLTATIAIDEGDFAIDVQAGTDDPILVTVPLPDPTRLLGAADVVAVAAAYGLDPAARDELVAIAEFLTALTAELGPQGVLAVEISNFGLGVRPTGPTVTGQAKLVQLPRFLELLTPLSQLRVGLGAEVDKIFLTLDRVAGSAQEPLLTVPVPGDTEVDVYFRGFLLAYAWGRNEFAFALDAGAEPRKTLTVGAGGSGVLVPAVKADMKLGATVTAPPAPMPEGVLSFRRAQRAASDRAVDELGLQAVIGSGQRRAVTAYLRHVEFSPIYFLLWPGFGGDAGLVLGGPNPRDLPTAAAYLDVRAWDRREFFARFTVRDGSLIFFDAPLGLMLNPLAAVPPFVAANPPYWIVPPLIMGDLYAEEIGVSVNLPGLAFLDLTFERPLPSFSLLALLELAALAAGGFTRPIATTSPLRKMFYARVRVFLELQPLGLGGAGAPVSMTVEVNVADLINGAMDLMHKATATLNAGSDLLGEVTRDPAALVRMLPRATRRLAYDIELGGFDFSGSLYLLTPDELRDELMLFFENKRRRARGIAANQPPQTPPTTQPVNQRPVLVGRTPVRWRGILDLRSLEPDVLAIGKRTLLETVAAQRTRETRLDGWQRDKQRNMDQTADFVADAVAALPVGDVAGRRALLGRLGMANLVAPVEAALVGAGTQLRPPALERRVRAVVVAELRGRDEVMIADSGLSGPPEEVAARLIARVVPAPIPARPLARILPGSDRRKEIDKIVPVARAARAHRLMTDAFDQLERELTTAGPATPAGRRAIADTTRLIIDALTQQFAVRRGQLDALVGPGIDPDALSDLVRTRALRTWAASPRVTDRKRDVGVFDGVHFAGVLRGVDLFAPRPAVPTNVVEEVVGYQIQPRGGAGFAVPVPTAGALYKVVLDGGRYRLHVRQKGRSWQAHDLPAALVDPVIEGPNKADMLRDQLIVTPRTTRRPRTSAEIAAVAEQFEQSSDLYLTSVLARPEYEVKPEGGVHGPFYLADLLRDPRSGDYTVPSGPTLLGGFRARLFDSELRFGGILTGGGPRTSAFLYGHHTLDIAVGGFRVRALGDFVAGSGSLWRTIPAPSGTLHAQDAVGFSGHLMVSYDDHGGRASERGDVHDTLLEGSAEGNFSRAGDGSTTARLTVRVCAEGSVDVGVGESEFFRVGWTLDGDLDVTLTSRLTLATSATATVSVERAVYQTTWEVVEPAHTVCTWFYFIDSPLPPKGHWGWLCATTPEIRQPNINFSTPPNWEPLASASCALQASVSDDGVAAFGLDLTGLGAVVTGAIGTSLSIPNLG
ncbi:MAG: hypothetical protein WCF36_11620 [Candidatus Nanopelagicales bacterium]